MVQTGDKKDMSRVFHNGDGPTSEEGQDAFRSRRTDSGDDWSAGDAEAKALEEAFNKYDKNNDGFISAEELQAVLREFGHPEGESLQKCQELIDHVDGNRDGLCDMEEFLKMMRRKTPRRRSIPPKNERGSKSQNSVLRGILASWISNALSKAGRRQKRRNIEQR